LHVKGGTLHLGDPMLELKGASVGQKDATLRFGDETFRFGTPALHVLSGEGYFNDGMMHV